MFEIERVAATLIVLSLVCTSKSVESQQTPFTKKSWKKLYAKGENPLDSQYDYLSLLNSAKNNMARRNLNFDSLHVV